MTRFARQTWFHVVALFGIGGVTLLVGCDSGGVKRDSLFQQLIGTWRIDRVELNRNEINFDDEDPVLVEFLERDDEVRSYRIIRSASSDTTQTGQLTVPRSNIIRMAVESGLLEWSFDFEEPEDVSESVRFRLRSGTDQTVRDFLETIGVGGAAERLQLDFERDSG